MKLGNINNVVMGLTQISNPTSPQTKDFDHGVWMSKYQSQAVLFDSNIVGITSGYVLFENDKYRITFSGTLGENKVYTIEVKDIHKFYSLLNKDNIDLSNRDQVNMLISEFIIKFEKDNFEHHQIINKEIIVNSNSQVQDVELSGDLNNRFKTSWGVYDSHTNDVNVSLNLDEYDFLTKDPTSAPDNLKIKINNIKLLFFEDVIDPPVSHSSFALSQADQSEWNFYDQSKLGSTTGNGEQWWHGFLDAVSIGALAPGAPDSPGIIGDIFNKYADFNDNDNGGVHNLVTLIPKQNSFMPAEHIYRKKFDSKWNVGARATSLLGNDSHISILGVSVNLNYDLEWDTYKR